MWPLHAPLLRLRAGCTSSCRSLADTCQDRWLPGEERFQGRRGLPRAGSEEDRWRVEVCGQVYRWIIHTHSEELWARRSRGLRKAHWRKPSFHSRTGEGRHPVHARPLVYRVASQQRIARTLVREEKKTPHPQFVVNDDCDLSPTVVGARCGPSPIWLSSTYIKNSFTFPHHCGRRVANSGGETWNYFWCR